MYILRLCIVLSLKKVLGIGTSSNFGFQVHTFVDLKGNIFSIAYPNTLHWEQGITFGSISTLTCSENSNCKRLFVFGLAAQDGDT